MEDQDENCDCIKDDLLEIAEVSNSSVIETNKDAEPLDLEKTEKCILNDEMLAWLSYFKVSVCVTAPILQISVIIAARTCGGTDVWTSASTTFAERSWAH